MDQDVSAALCRTYFAYFALGGDVIRGQDCRVIRQDAAPIIHDVNHIQVGADADPDATFAFLEANLGDRPYRQVYASPATSPAVVARLVLEDYEPDPTLQHLLIGELQGRSPLDHVILPVVTNEDWKHLHRLVRADHVETAEKQGHPPYSEEVTSQMQVVRRNVADQIHFFMAWADDEPVGFFSSWPGIDDIGMVEDLFTLPRYRNRGVARALIHHCVADARARGAGPVLIGSEPWDTPKHLYAAMGFAPTCVTSGWLKQIPSSKSTS